MLKFEKDENNIAFFTALAREQLEREPEYVKVIMEEILRISQKNGYKNAGGEAHLYLGWYYYKTSQYKKAIQKFDEAINVFKQQNNKSGMGRVYNALMATYMHTGIFEVAISNGIEGIEIADEIGNQRLWRTLVINTAIAYTMFDKYQEAFEMVNRIEQINLEFTSIEKIDIACIMSEVSINQNKLNEAYYYCMEAYEEAKKNNCELTMLQILNVKAKILASHGNYEEAYKLFEEALAYGRKYKQKILMICIYLEYTKCLTVTLKYDESIEKLQKAEIIAKELQLNYQLKNIYLKMSKIYEYQNEYKKAYEHLKESAYYGEQLINFSNTIAYWRFTNKRLGLKAQLYEELYTKTESLAKIGQTLTANLNLENVCKILMEEIPNVINSDKFGIAFYQKNKGVLNYELAIKGSKPVLRLPVPISSDKHIEAYCVRNNKPVYIGNADKQIPLYCPYYKVVKSEIEAKSGIYYPLKINNQVIGILSVEHYTKYAYGHQDLSIIEMFAPYVAIAIWNAKLFNQVEYFASYDELTQILNRRQLFKRGMKYLHYAKTKHQKLSLVMFDIDYFKQINDNYGHTVGDTVIKEVVNCAKREMKDNDIIGRYGGEEFILVLPNENQQIAYFKAEMIRKQIMAIKSEELGMGNTPITASFGVYEFSELERDFLDGTKKVDDALYKAKNMGRNMVVCYDQLEMIEEEENF
ncbi:MAG: diguanylate cyclase [Cellulosilyticaceae bacterium]